MLTSNEDSSEVVKGVQELLRSYIQILGVSCDTPVFDSSSRWIAYSSVNKTMLYNTEDIIEAVQDMTKFRERLVLVCFYLDKIIMLKDDVLGWSILAFKVLKMAK